MAINIPVRADIAKNLEKYSRVRILLDNDEDQYTSDTFCLRFPNEPENARTIRKNLLKTSFKNITNDLISATKDAIFHEGIRLEFNEGAQNPLSTWSKNITRGMNGMSLLQYVADIVVYGLRAYGHVWTVLDKPDYTATDLADEMENGAPYVSNIYPGNAVNYEIENGDLKWFAYRYNYIKPWEDPLVPMKEQRLEKQTRIWTRDQFIVVDEKNNTYTRNHNFGFVPVIYQSFIQPNEDGTIIGQTPFFTSSNMIIFANNMQSVGDMEIIKHGTSVLLVHEDGVSSMNTEVDDKGEVRTKLQDAPGFNKYVYGGEREPRYLTKDLAAVDKANSQADYYFNAAIQNERTLQSIFRKRDTVRESGITKDYDSEPTRAGLRATAEDLESWCKKVLNMAARMLGRDDLIDSFTCEFPESYIITKTLNEKFDEIIKMLESRYPSVTGIKEAYKSLTPDIAHNSDVREVINKEIDDAEIDIETEKEILDEVNKEMEDEAEFEKSMEGMSEEEKQMKRSERKLTE